MWNQNIFILLLSDWFHLYIIRFIIVSLTESSRDLQLYLLVNQKPIQWHSYYILRIFQKNISHWWYQDVASITFMKYLKYLIHIYAIFQNLLFIYYISEVSGVEVSILLVLESEEPVKVPPLRWLLLCHLSGQAHWKWLSR